MGCRGNAYWLRFTDKVDVIRSPIADDAYSRIYWSGDTRMGGALLYSYLLQFIQAVERIPHKLLQVRDSCAKRINQQQY